MLSIWERWRFNRLVRRLLILNREDRENYHNARRAARTIARVAGSKAILPLCQALEHELRRNPEDWLVTLKVTNSIIAALKELNAVHEVPKQTLIVAMQSKANTDVNDWAIGVLAERGDITNNEVLYAALDSDWHKLRITACQTLAKLNVREAIEYIKPLLNDPEEGVREAATEAIEQLSKPAS